MNHTFFVWHADAPTFEDPQRRFIARTFPLGYTLVAKVTGEDGEDFGAKDIFGLTNHIDHAWTSNPGVTVVGRRRKIRSTSVGDIYTTAPSGPSFRGWIVNSVGLSRFRSSLNRKAAPTS